MNKAEILLKQYLYNKYKNRQGDEIMGIRIEMEKRIDSLQSQIKKLEDTLQDILNLVGPKKETKATDKPKSNNKKKVKNESVDEA